jgi:hypothetical protein
MRNSMDYLDIIITQYMYVKMLMKWTILLLIRNSQKIIQRGLIEKVEDEYSAEETLKQITKFS